MKEMVTLIRTVRKVALLACAVALGAFLLSACAVESYVAPSTAPPSPYFSLTASPSASEVIDQTVEQMNAITEHEAAAQAAEAAARAEAEAQAAAATESSAAAPYAASDAYGYEYFSDSDLAGDAVGGQSADQCIPDLVLNF
ncbi:MAG: hypothetical protein LBO07_07595 [Coriobacteriales bacterium]|jgi:hypothetical protein|nr:hypothetical protein [Coriobacteriales bacterium]